MELREYLCRRGNYCIEEVARTMDIPLKMMTFD
jgi:hypothetical protein